MDHGILNLPLAKRGAGSLNSQIDAWKRGEADTKRAAAKANAAAKKEARALYQAHGATMIKVNAPKFGPKVAGVIRDMSIWEPEKFISFTAKFLAEQAA